jgi:hypothetical protein
VIGVKARADVLWWRAKGRDKGKGTDTEAEGVEIFLRRDKRENTNINY